jgi:hypothetical protein
MAAGILLTAIWAAPNVVLAPMSTLVRHTLADDAFYYFGLARHFPNPAFDAGVPTTGFHPLYWMLIGPVFRVVPGTAAIKVALVLLLAAHVGTGLVLWRLVRRHLGVVPAVGTGLTWMLEPHVRALALLGVETALVTLSLAVLLLVVDAQPVSPRRALLVGAVAGVSFLARTDSVVIVLVIVATWMIRSRSGGLRLAVRSAGAFGAAAFAVASPWLAYLAARGAVGRQDSQVAENLLSPRHGLTWSFLGPVWQFVAGHLAYGIDPWVRPGGLPPAVEEMMIGALILGAILAVKRGTVASAWLTVAGPLASGTVLLFIAYGVVFHHLSAWYVLYAFLALWVTVVSPVLALVADAVRDCRLEAVFAVVAAAALIAMCFATQQDFEPGQLDKYRAVENIAALVPPGQVMGAMNDGLVAFFHPGGSVDLDGVVDSQATDAIRQAHMCQFVRARRIAWFLDDAGALNRLLRLGPGLIADPVIQTSTVLRQPVVGQVQVLARLRADGCALR